MQHANSKTLNRLHCHFSVRSSFDAFSLIGDMDIFDRSPTSWVNVDQDVLVFLSVKLEIGETKPSAILLTIVARDTPL